MNPTVTQPGGDGGADDEGNPDGGSVANKSLVMTEGPAPESEVEAVVAWLEAAAVEGVNHFNASSN